jgi:hypothetical protein
MQNAEFRMQTISASGQRLWAASAFCILISAFALDGCAKTQAKAVPDGPPLAVPMAPPRVVAPTDAEPLAANPPAPEPASAPPPRTTARPNAATPPRRSATTATTEPEPKPETPAAAPETPVVTPRPVPPPADAAADRRVRDILRKATTDLNRVDYQRLSTDGKAQYELSKRFSDQAEQALKDRNYAFATTVAEKASAVATELLGR